MMIRRNAIVARRNGLSASHSEHLTEPLRGTSWVVRRAIRPFVSVAYSAVRPFAHWAKPMLWRLAHKPAARKLVIRVFGRHSTLVNTARLFLIGAPVSSSSVETTHSAEMLAEGESLSVRGREILLTLVEMRTQAKGESQRASRT